MKSYVIYPLPKIGNTDERKMLCYDCGHKRKIETGAIGNTRQHVSELFRGLEKKGWHKCIISEGDKIVIDKYV